MFRSIRDYINLVEAAWKISYSYGYRSWYHPATDEWINVASVAHDATHVKVAYKFAQKFGVDKEKLKGLKPIEKNTLIKNYAFAAGWIRIAGADRNNPQKFMIFEGSDLKAMLKLLKRFFQDQGGELETAAIKVRDLNGDSGQEYELMSIELIKNALRGELPSPRHYDSEDSI